MMSLKDKLLAGALTVSLATGVFLYAQVQQARESAREAALRADSIEAVTDTTRFVARIQYLEGTADFWQRRAVQSEVEADSLDRRLGQESVARAEAEAQLAAIDTELQTNVFVDEDDVRSAIFDEETDRYLLHAEVVLPPADELATGNFRVELKPVPILLRLSCQETDTDISQAHIAFGVPTGVELTVRRAVQDPRICNPQLYERDPFSIFGVTIPEAPIAGAVTGAAAGYVAGQSTEDAIGGALIGAVTLWAFDQTVGNLFD